jgi:hypothetical protein
MAKRTYFVYFMMLFCGTVALVQAVSVPKSVWAFAPDGWTKLADSGARLPQQDHVLDQFSSRIHGFVRGKQTQLLEVELPTQYQNKPGLFLNALASLGGVFCDGKLVWVTPEVHNDLQAHIKYPWILVPMEGVCSKIQILVTSSHSYLGVFGKTMIGPTAGLALAVFQHQLPFFVLSLFLLACSLFVGFLGLVENSVFRLSMFLSLVGSSTGVYFICRTSVRQWIFDENFPWFTLELGSLYLCPMFLVLFAEQVWKIGYLKHFTIFYSVAHFCGLFLSGILFSHSGQTLPSFQVCFLISVVWMVGLFLRDLRKASREVVIVFGSVAILLLGSFVDLIRSIFNLPWVIDVAPWSYALMMVSLGSILHLRFREVNRLLHNSLSDAEQKATMLEAQQKKLEVMWTELEQAAFVMGDGIGNSLTRISVAAENMSDLCEDKGGAELLKASSKVLESVEAGSTKFKDHLIKLKACLGRASI